MIFLKLVLEVHSITFVVVVRETEVLDKISENAFHVCCNT